MELETQPEANLGEWSAEALCECVFHRINKKILTIIISAHSPTPKRRFRCGSPINMNAMITDCSFLL